MQKHTTAVENVIYYSCMASPNDFIGIHDDVTLCMIINFPFCIQYFE